MRACEMCPPSAVDTALILSPGWVSALSAAMLDTVPEVLWMLANSQLKICFANWIPSDSMSSKSSQPW